MDLSNWIAVLAGIAVRLLIPILATALVVYLLRRLDERWQTEGEKAPAVPVEKPSCWKLMGCSPQERKSCLGYTSPLPCWQARRTSNGYLREQCLGCKVFLKAPVPSVG